MSIRASAVVAANDMPCLTDELCSFHTGDAAAEWRERVILAPLSDLLVEVRFTQTILH